MNENISMSAEALMNRPKLNANSDAVAVAKDEEQMTALKKKRRQEKGHDTLGKKLCSQKIPLKVSYNSWKDTNKFSAGFEKTMKENSADQMVRSAKINIYGESGLTESHVNSITKVSKELGEKKLLSAFVNSGKSLMNKQVTMNILAQAKLYVASLMSDNNPKKDGDRGEEDEQDLAFINNANAFLTKLFSLDSVIQESDLPPLFFCKAIFAAFKKDTPVCNQFDLPKLYESNDDIAHRVLLWRLFQAEALYAVFSRFALTLAKGVGFAAKLVEVIDVAASSYRVYYRYYYCGGCWYWRSYSVSVPEVKHVEYQGKDAPGLRVIMNSLLINVNTQAQTLLDYDSIVAKQLILMKEELQDFMNSNFEQEIRLLFKSMDALFNTANKLGLLSDDIKAVTLELDHCLNQINAVSYTNIYNVLKVHRTDVKSFNDKQKIHMLDYKLNHNTILDSLVSYSFKVKRMYEESFSTAFMASISVKDHIMEYNSNDRKFLDDSKDAGNKVKTFLAHKTELKTVIRESGISALLGAVVGKIVDLTTRGRVDMEDILESQDNNIKKNAEYNNMILELRDEVKELKGEK